MHTASIPCLPPLLLIKDTTTTLREHPQIRLCQIDVSAPPKVTWVESCPVALLPQTSLLQLQSYRDSLFSRTQRPLSRGGSNIVRESNWLLHVLTVNSSANLCHGRSQLSRCSSGCAGKSLGNQVTGWCQSFPGYNRHTVLVTQVQKQNRNARRTEERNESGEAKSGKKLQKKWQNLSEFTMQ